MHHVEKAVAKDEAILSLTGGGAHRPIDLARPETLQQSEVVQRMFFGSGIELCARIRGGTERQAKRDNASPTERRLHRRLGVSSTRVRFVTTRDFRIPTHGVVTGST